MSRGPKTCYISNGTASGGLQWQYIVNCHILRPPDLSVGGLTFYQGFFYYLLSSSFIRRLMKDPAAVIDTFATMGGNTRRLDLLL